MTINLSGLGDASACGTDPCTWWDSIYTRDDCLKYKACVDPTDYWTLAEQKGLISASAVEVVDAAGTVVSAVGQNAGAAVGTTAGSALEHLFKNPDGSINWSSVGLVGAAGLLAMAILKGK